MEREKVRNKELEGQLVFKDQLILDLTKQVTKAEAEAGREKKERKKVEDEKRKTDKEKQAAAMAVAAEKQRVTYLTAETKRLGEEVKRERMQERARTEEETKRATTAELRVATLVVETQHLKQRVEDLSRVGVQHHTSNSTNVIGIESFMMQQRRPLAAPAPSAHVELEDGVEAGSGVDPFMLMMMMQQQQAQQQQQQAQQAQQQQFMMLTLAMGGPGGKLGGGPGGRGGGNRRG